MELWLIEKETETEWEKNTEAPGDEILQKWSETLASYCVMLAPCFCFKVI